MVLELVDSQADFVCNISCHHAAAAIALCGTAAGNGVDLAAKRCDKGQILDVIRHAGKKRADDAAKHIARACRCKACCARLRQKRCLDADTGCRCALCDDAELRSAICPDDAACRLEGSSQRVRRRIVKADEASELAAVRREHKRGVSPRDLRELIEMPIREACSSSVFAL